MRQDSLVSYADLERAGWPQNLIDDYMGRLREMTPVQGAENDPNGVHESNLNGFYFSLGPPTTLWFNPSPGETTGWQKVV